MAKLLKDLQRQIEKEVRRQITPKISYAVQSAIRSPEFAARLVDGPLAQSDLVKFAQSEKGRGWLGILPGNDVTKDFLGQSGKLLLNGWLQSHTKQRDQRGTRIGISVDTNGLDKEYSSKMTHSTPDNGEIYWYKLTFFAKQFPFMSRLTHGFLHRRGYGRSGHGIMVKKSIIKRGGQSGMYFPIRVEAITAPYWPQTVEHMLSDTHTSMFIDNDPAVRKIMLKHIEQVKQAWL